MKVVSEKDGIVVMVAGKHSLAGVWAGKEAPADLEYAVEIDMTRMFTWGVDVHPAPEKTCSVVYNGTANQFQGSVLSCTPDGIVAVDAGVTLVMLEAQKVPAGVENIVFTVAPADVRVYPVIL